MPRACLPLGQGVRVEPSMLQGGPRRDSLSCETHPKHTRPRVYVQTTLARNGEKEREEARARKTRFPHV